MQPICSLFPLFSFRTIHYDEGMPQPNILFITSDQQHWNTIGRFFPEIRTPALDRLTREGTTFTRAYCPNPTCTPSRASMITGRMPSRHGAWSLGTKLPEAVPTVGDLLQQAGYGTGLIGKAHFQQLVDHLDYRSLESHPLVRDLGRWKDFHGPFYGFEHVELARNHCDEAHVGQHYALWMEEKGLPNWADHFQNHWGSYEYGGAKRGGQHGRWTLPEAYHLNRWIEERSIAFMEREQAADRPFVCWASFFDPHPPYLVPEPWDSLYDPASLTVPQVTPGEHDRNPRHFQLTQEAKPDFHPWQETAQGSHGMHSHLRDREVLAKDIAIYYGMTSFMDDAIGHILAWLDRAGLSENTLVVFTSDHGHFYGQHGLTAKGPFHYEDEIRVPFIVRWPGHVPADQQNAALQSLVDLPTTFLQAVGAQPDPEMQGVNQLPVWTGQASKARERLTVEFRHQPTTIHLKTLVEARYKLTVYYNQPEEGELFDLESDPGEIHNLWHDPAASGLKADLTRRLLDYEMGQEPLWMPRVAAA